jgi:hypothetical protein
MELNGNRLERWKGDGSLIAAHAKLGMNVGGASKSFSSPVKSMAKGASPQGYGHPRQDQMAGELWEQAEHEE